MLFRAKNKKVDCPVHKTGSQPFTVVRRNACPYCRYIPSLPAQTVTDIFHLDIITQFPEKASYLFT
jgi:hypothetical protein